MAEKRQRIPNTTAGLMLAAALVFDLLSIIPLLNVITTLSAGLIFWLWFVLRGVNFSNNRKHLLVWGGGLLIELMPLLSLLPGLTASVASTIVMVKLEDKKNTRNG